MEYIGNDSLIKKIILDVLRPISFNTNTHRLILIELSFFKSLYELKSMLDLYQKENRNTYILFIQPSIVILPLFAGTYVNLHAPVSVWKKKLNQLAVQKKHRIDNIISRCEEILQQKIFTATECKVIELIAYNLNVKATSQQSRLSITHVYRILQNINMKLNMPGLHHLILYLKNEYTMLHDV